MKPTMKTDRGAALGLVLIFITILGVWIGAIFLVTQVTTSGNAVLAKQAAQTSDVAKATAAAIAQLKHDLSAGLPAAGVQTNCNLPTTSVTTVTVTCTPIAVTNGATPGAVITTATTGSTPGVDFGTQITGPFTFDNSVQTLSNSLVVDQAASLNQAGCAPNCSASGSVTPSAPALTGTVGTPYISAISVAGGTAPYSFTKSGSLPSGLTMNPTTGAITGTPTTTGPSTLTVTVTDNDLLTGSTTFTIVISAAAAADVVSVTKPSELSTSGQCFSSRVSASGGVAPYTFSITSGSLPTGLSMSSSGQISGTPTAAGTSVTVTARDSNGVTGTTTFNIAVAAAVQTLSLTAPTKGLDAFVNQPYSLNVSATGGVGSLTFSADNLPAGLTMSSGGWIHGTPTVTTNATTVNVHVTDSGSPAATRDASFVMTSTTLEWVDNLALTASVLKVKANTKFSLVLPLISGWGTNTFTATSSMPGWASLNSSTGVISGTATSSSGTYSFNVTVTDGKGKQATASATITVTSSGTSSSLALSQPSTATGMVGEWFQAGYGVTGGNTVSTFALASGTLPAGLTLNQTTGVISGSPTSSGTFTSYIKVTDTSGNSSSSTKFTFTINTASSSLAISTPTTGISGTAGQYFQSEIAAVGGSGTYSYSLTNGSLPSGLSLSSTTGAISGTPTLTSSTNTYTGLTVRVSDGTSTRTTSSFTITIVGATSTLAIVTPVDGLNGLAGKAYQLGIASTGGSCGSKSYSLIAGTLPVGVTLSSSTGAISGTLTSLTNATYPGLVVKVTDSSTSPSSTASTNPFTITVTFTNNLTIISPPAAALKASTNRSYQLGSTTSGGVGSTRIFSYSYKTTIPGLGDSTSGVLSGTPTATGTYDVTESVTDSYSTATTSYSILITAGTVAPKIDHCYQQDSKCSTDDEGFKYDHQSQHEDFYCGSDGDIHGTIHSGKYDEVDVDAMNRVFNPTSADISRDRYLLPVWSNSTKTYSYSTSRYSNCRISSGHIHEEMEDGEIEFAGTHELLVDNDNAEFHNQHATMDTKTMTCKYTSGIQSQSPSKQADFHGTTVYFSSGLQLKRGSMDICGPNVAYGTSKAIVIPTPTQASTASSRKGSSRAPQALSSAVNFNVYKSASLHVAGNANAQNAKFYLEQNPSNPSYISGGLLAAGATLTTTTKSNFPAPNSLYAEGRVIRLNVTNKTTGVVTSKLVYINDQSGSATPGRQTSTFLGSTK